jgi:hypothetical protein
MKRLILLLCSSTALGTTLSLQAVAQEYSNGGINQKGRKDATLTPVEAFGVHPPGPDPADAKRCIFRRWRKTYIPYYAPAAPVATSVRWAPWCYFPLMPYYTPYYIGYTPHRLCQRKPPPYGSDGWGQGPMPCSDGPVAPPLNYGAYTSILQDDTIFWNMGGNGLVPYGTPRPPHEGPPDLVDAIQSTRASGGGACGACAPCVNGAPVAAWNVGPGPAIQTPAENQNEKGSPVEDKESKEMLPTPKSGSPEK